MNHESRPEAANADSTPIKSDSIVPSNPLAELSIGRRTWVRRYIEHQAHTGPAPEYGSTEWLALPDDDMRKWISAVKAAECWAQEGDNLEPELRREVAEMQRQHKLREDEEYQQSATAHRERYGNPPTRKSFVERRSEQIHSATGRSDDYPGGGKPGRWGA